MSERKYKSGESPMIGDCIECVDPEGGHRLKPGDRTTVVAIDDWGDPLTDNDKQIGRYGAYAWRYRLVSRCDAKNDELASLRQQLGDLQTRMADSIKTNSGMKELLVARSDRIADLESQLAARDARIAELEAAAGAMREAIIAYTEGRVPHGRDDHTCELCSLLESSTAGRDFAKKLKALEADCDRLQGIVDQFTQLAKATHDAT